MTFEGLADRLARVREEIARVQAAHGLSHPVTIVAVTKGHPPAAATAAAQAGLPDVGENRVQEALEKIAAVDSRRLAEALHRAAERHGTTIPVLVQVNVAREPQKGGCAPAEAAELIASCAEMPGLAIRGLMAMAPFTDDESVQRAVFAGLRELRSRVATPACPLPELSMGMSGDYPAALAEGSTMLRLGTVLFGERTA
jgi:uncharacterized pyridoxal phosphate-containing UPF0001 family protein